MMNNPNQVMPQFNEKNYKNPAEDPSYKPEKQLFGYVLTYFAAIVTLFLAVASLGVAFSGQVLFDYVKTHKDRISYVLAEFFPDINKLFSENMDAFIDKIFWTLLTLSAMLALDAYFFIVVLAYPDYCGGNPEFYKTWPLLLSYLLLVLNDAWNFRFSIGIFSITYGLALFGIKYALFFGHDSSDNCCCICVGFKPWVYKRSHDLEAPVFHPSQYPEKDILVNAIKHQN